MRELVLRLVIICLRAKIPTDASLKSVVRKRAKNVLLVTMRKRTSAGAKLAFPFPNLSFNEEPFATWQICNGVGDSKKKVIGMRTLIGRA